MIQISLSLTGKGGAHPTTHKNYDVHTDYDVFDMTMMSLLTMMSMLFSMKEKNFTLPLPPIVIFLFNLLNSFVV